MHSTLQHTTHSQDEIETHAHTARRPSHSASVQLSSPPPTSTIPTTTATANNPQLRATLRLPGPARDRRAHKVLAR